MRRDLLTADPAVPEGGTLSQSNSLLVEQAEYLAEIAMYLRRQNADVLATAVVKSTSQLSNAIYDNYCHEVVFEVGGKPVEIFNLLAYSTVDGAISMSVLSMSKYTDGIPFGLGDVYNFDIPTNSVYIMTTIDVSTTPLIVNGPANSIGGFYLYGYTTPDWDRLRGSLRS